MDDEGNSIFILVLDDNYIVGSDILGILRSNGYSNAHLVPSCSEALELIEKGFVDAAILDVRLSDGETTESVGLALLEKQIPFFFMTGYARLTEAFPPELAAVRLQAKPYRESDLLAGVQQLVTESLTLPKR